jgi:hypothetical protein
MRLRPLESNSASPTSPAVGRASALRASSRGSQLASSQAMQPLDAVVPLTFPHEQARTRRAATARAACKRNSRGHSHARGSVADWELCRRQGHRSRTAWTGAGSAGAAGRAEYTGARRSTSTMPAANTSAGALGPFAAPRPAPPSRAPTRSGARYASGSTSADAGIAARSARPTSESFAYCTR